MVFKTTTKTRVLTVRGVRYSARMWAENVHGCDGFNYVVHDGGGLLLCNGWSAGTDDETVKEAMDHLRQRLMGL